MHRTLMLRRQDAMQPLRCPHGRSRQTPMPSARKSAAVHQQGQWVLGKLSQPMDHSVRRRLPKTSTGWGPELTTVSPDRLGIGQAPGFAITTRKFQHDAAAFSAMVMPFGVRSAAGPPMKTIGVARRPKACGDGRRKTPGPHCGQEQHCEGQNPRSAADSGKLWPSHGIPRQVAEHRAKLITRRCMTCLGAVPAMD